MPTASMSNQGMPTEIQRDIQPKIQTAARLSASQIEMATAMRRFS
jgi:hypothetical protein